MEIVANNLAKRFERNWLFKGLTYTFKAGERYAIIGPNGSGKSTLLQILAGFMPPTSGKVSYEGGDAKQYEMPGRITFASPAMELIEEFTLHELLQYHYGIMQQPTDEKLQWLAEQFQLSHAFKKPILHFSSGMKQRVKLGLAFYSQASYILLDEPTTNLDKAGVAWYYELLQMPRQAGVIIASNLAHEYESWVSAALDITDFK